MRQASCRQTQLGAHSRAKRLAGLAGVSVALGSAAKAAGATKAATQRLQESYASFDHSSGRGPVQVVYPEDAREARFLRAGT